MTSSGQSEARVPGFCSLCKSHCGCVSVVEGGRLVKVEPDPSHPTGSALCGKGRAAPELVHHDRRLTQPLVRTRPKADSDPGWRAVSWEEALDRVADGLRQAGERSGRKAVAFGLSTPSGTGLVDSYSWLYRFIGHFGSPNTVDSTEVCNWHKDVATRFTYGMATPLPDYEQTGCILLWGFNPRAAWLAQMTKALEAVGRGAKLVVVDPRRNGLAGRADSWLRVRPGADGALALSMAAVMLEEGWYDEDFVRDWTNAPLLVRRDTGRLVTAEDLGMRRDRLHYVGWDASAGAPVLYDPRSRRFEGEVRVPLDAAAELGPAAGPIAAATVFSLYRDLCAEHAPERAEGVTWVPADEVREAARLLWEARPTSYYAWTGVAQGTNATQTARALSALYALTGCFDAPGGNVIFPAPPTKDPAAGAITPELARESVAYAKRPLGPPAGGSITSDDLYRAILDQDPYGIEAFMGFGLNVLLSHPDPVTGAEALRRLRFHVQVDQFMTPTAELADVVLPASTSWEREALRPGFDVGFEAQATLQLRPQAVDPVGEARSDMWIVFQVARRLGLGDQFWDGDLEAAQEWQLEPTGVTLEQLRSLPGGRLTMDLGRDYRKHEETGADGKPRGFPTPTGRLEIYSEELMEHGHGALPDYREPTISPMSRPDLLAEYPLVLTCAKVPQFCHSQHRAVTRLRRNRRRPSLEIHPEAAAERGIDEGEWVAIRTPAGEVRAQAAFNDTLDPRVVCGEHGWWQAAPQIDEPGYDPLSAAGANFNLLVGHDEVDPVSGSTPMRQGLCEVARVAEGT